MTKPSYTLPRSVQFTIIALGLFVAVLGITLLQVTHTSVNQSNAILQSQTQISSFKEELAVALTSIDNLSSDSKDHQDTIKALIQEVVRLRTIISQLHGNPGPLPSILITPKGN